MPISPGQSGVIFRGVVCQSTASETLSGLLKCNRAGALDVKSACAPARKVNRGVRFGWYPVVDAHDQGAAVLLIHHAHPRSQRQGFMSRRPSVWIELLAARGPPRMLVPGGASAAELSAAVVCGPGSLQPSLRGRPTRSGDLESPAGARADFRRACRKVFGVYPALSLRAAYAPPNRSVSPRSGGPKQGEDGDHRERHERLPSVQSKMLARAHDALLAYGPQSQRLAAPRRSRRHHKSDA